MIPTREEFRQRGAIWEAGWIAGCHAEAAARDEDLSKEARAVRAVVEGLGQLKPEYTEAELAGAVFRIYTCGQPWWRRIRLARCLK